MPADHAMARVVEYHAPRMRFHRASILMFPLRILLLVLLVAEGLWLAWHTPWKAEIDL